MIHEPVGARGRFAGLAHAHEIGREAPTVLGKVWNDVAPEIGRGRIPVQEDDGIASTDIDVAHLGIEDVCASAKAGIDAGRFGHGHFGYFLV